MGTFLIWGQGSEEFDDFPSELSSLLDPLGLHGLNTDVSADE